MDIESMRKKQAPQRPMVAVTPEAYRSLKEAVQRDGLKMLSFTSACLLEGLKVYEKLIKDETNEKRWQSEDREENA